MTKRQKSDLVRSFCWAYGIMFSAAIIASMDIIVQKLFN